MVEEKEVGEEEEKEEGHSGRGGGNKHLSCVID